MASPTSFPSVSPTYNPTIIPTIFPTVIPTSFPTLFPTVNPVQSPSTKPIQLQVDNGVVNTTLTTEPTSTNVTNDNIVIYNPEQDDDGNTFYILIMALISVIIATLFSVMLGLFYFCRKQKKSKQKRMRKVKQLDSMSMSPQINPMMMSPSISEPKEIRISIKSAPSLDIAAVTPSPIINGALFSDNLEAPSAIELEGRMKNMSQNDLYDSMDGTNEILLQRGNTTESNALCDDNVTAEGSEEEQEQDEGNDDLQNTETNQTQDSNNIDTMYALPENTADVTEK